jgi:hypothetical protein
VSASQAFERRQLAWRGWRRRQGAAKRRQRQWRRREVWRLGLSAWTGGLGWRLGTVGEGCGGWRRRAAAGDCGWWRGVTLTVS